jgi:hypothetical protein
MRLKGLENLKVAKTIKLKLLFPFLVDELSKGLLSIGERGLARSVSDLEIVGRCDCDNQGCGAFYTVEKNQWAARENLRQVVPAVKGLYAIDVLDKQIVCVDFIGRMDVRDRLVAVFP